MNEYLDKVNTFCIAFVLGLVVGGIFGYCTSNKLKTTSPVEESRIDSLVNQREEIKIKINKLDSIKDAKIIEVINLDNDSTLKLFYELVRE